MSRSVWVTVLSWVTGCHVAKATKQTISIDYVWFQALKPDVWALPFTPTCLQNHLSIPQKKLCLCHFLFGLCSSNACSVYVYVNEHAYLGYTKYLPVPSIWSLERIRSFMWQSTIPLGNRRIQPKLMHFPPPRTAHSRPLLPAHLEVNKSDSPEIETITRPPRLIPNSTVSAKGIMPAPKKAGKNPSSPETL